MQLIRLRLFSTAIGPCGVAWGPGGIVAVQLPEPTEAATRQRMLKGLPRGHTLDPSAHDAVAPPAIQAAVSGIQALLAGERRDLQELVLDMSGISDFHQKVYGIARAIAPGQTRTYGDVAEALGDKRWARAVGQALGSNPFAPVVPCHRVLAAGGRAGGFSAGGGTLTKLRMLEIEGAALGGTASLFD